MIAFSGAQFQNVLGARHTFSNVSLLKLSTMHALYGTEFENVAGGARHVSMVLAL